MSAVERYRTAVVRRSAIKEHPLNPRSITPQARARLREGIKKHGLVQPFIVNEATGLLVGGHQRLSVVDEIEGYAHRSHKNDYEVTVAYVNLTETGEKEMLVLLNNASAGGQWDEYALLNIFTDPDVEQAMLGFSETEHMHVAALLKDAEKDADEAEKWLTEATEDYDALRADVQQDDVRAEEVSKRESKKSTWERTVEEMMPMPPPREGANTGKDSAFRAAREGWKKQEIEQTAIVRVIFENSVTKTKWLKAQGLAGDNETIHEKELPDQAWRGA